MDNDKQNEMNSTIKIFEAENNFTTSNQIEEKYISKCCRENEHLVYDGQSENPRCAASGDEFGDKNTLTLPSVNTSLLEYVPLTCKNSAWFFSGEYLEVINDQTLEITYSGVSIRPTKDNNSETNEISTTKYKDNKTVCMDTMELRNSSSSSLQFAANICSSEVGWLQVSELEISMQCREGTLCLRKCCFWNQHMDFTSGFRKCLSTPSNKNAFLKKFSKFSASTSKLHVVHGTEKCHEYYELVQAWSPEFFGNGIFHINENGDLELPNAYGVTPLSKFCADFGVFPESNEPTLVILRCVDKVPLGITAQTRVDLNSLGPLLSNTSLGFLALLLFLYGLFPKMRSFHGKCQMCFVLSHAVMYALNLILNTQLVAKENWSCYLTSLLTFYFVYCCRTWLLIGCYDMFRAFSSSRRVRRSEAQQKNKFIRFSLIGWGAPLVPTCFLAFFVISVSYPEEVPFQTLPFWLRYPLFRPACWIYDPVKRMVYLDGPGIVILMADLILLLRTIKSIFTTDRQTRAVSATYRNCLDRFHLYGRLVLMSGLSALFMTVSIHMEPSLFWTVVESAHYLHGVILFFLITTSAQNRRIYADWLRSSGVLCKRSSVSTNRTRSYKLKCSRTSGSELLGNARIVSVRKRDTIGDCAGASAQGVRAHDLDAQKTQSQETELQKAEKLDQSGQELADDLKFQATGVQKTKLHKNDEQDLQQNEKSLPNNQDNLVPKDQNHEIEKQELLMHDIELHQIHKHDSVNQETVL